MTKYADYTRYAVVLSNEIFALHVTVVQREVVFARKCKRPLYEYVLYSRKTFLELTRKGFIVSKSCYKNPTLIGK